jgi:hypothetical protein
MDVNGKTRPASKEGIASPKAKGKLKEAEGSSKEMRRRQEKG